MERSPIKITFILNQVDDKSTYTHHLHKNNESYSKIKPILIPFADDPSPCAAGKGRLFPPLGD